MSHSHAPDKFNRAFAIGVVLKDQDDLTYVAPRIDSLIMGRAA